MPLTFFQRTFIQLRKKMKIEKWVIAVLLFLNLKGMMFSVATKDGTLTHSLRGTPEVFGAPDSLSFTYYLKTCPELEGIIHRKVNAWIQKDFTLAAALIRLHFHDCAVRVHISYYFR